MSTTPLSSSGQASARVGIGTALPRVDGVAKVTGTARYAADYMADDGAHPTTRNATHPTANIAAHDLVYGFIVNSAIATGRIVSIDASAALATPGVLLVLTHENRPDLAPLDRAWKDKVAPGGMPFRPLYDDRVWYSGQPVALVIATSLELARHAASLLRIRYEPTPHQTALGEVLHTAYPPSTEKGGFDPPPPPRGKAYAALAKAHARVDAFYSTPVEFHQPMEMHGCTVVPASDGTYTVYEKTQGVMNTQQYLTRVFGFAPGQVRVVSQFVGGAFGSGLRPQYHLPLAMMAARELKRPVRVTLTRQQMFTFGHRPATVQHVALGARRDGRLAAIIHEAVSETSQFEDYADVTVNWAGQIYDAPNVQLGHKVAKLDVYTPCDMRAPGAAQGVFPLECAMDELAVTLGMDPLELRILNYAQRDANKDLPFSSNALLECYAQGAERFGWGARSAEPRSMREGRELVGWGMATGAWDAMQTEASARAVLDASGRLRVSSATADIGTGTYTAMTQIAADVLDIPLDDITFVLGDSSLPMAPLEGGSWTVSSVGSAVHAACVQLRSRLAEILQTHGGVAFANLDTETLAATMKIRDGRVRLQRMEEDSEHNSDEDTAASIALADLLHSARLRELDEQVTVSPDARQKQFSMGTFSAVFAEVRVDEALGEIRVSRVVSAVGAGRIVNPKTAANQVAGGVVWGIGMALHEHAQFDHSLGRVMNHNLAEYHMPVNRDVGEIDVLFVDEHDDVVNPLGAKGVGEIGVVGVAAAIANAVYHATGRRVRDLPITPDKVLESPR
ncbi:xanthine dehydrogenase family protein molybdopterin-binding subunit [Paraburkholderia kururiensis]|uniref:Xanthine dehydrogenase family protein molybdopterin-binding subunit n=1 Tax=Paraburkholderia kururiensis TaxID=984307 RepID=A0ABZ0WTG0_9BURK|nr:xanthine dehydrogenase family protein molybdopterin-binding subunit [Paraburkholderia kururiensis]WQD80530.1 xanthine dehydrogenase family protein molybdopterin-binding subunit [Paraburkholderia kururiensis]